MRKPVIGVTVFRTQGRGELVYLSVTEAYVKALLRAGAIPWLLPIGLDQTDLSQIRPMLDGLLLTGGGDIHPQNYGREMHARVFRVDPERDQLEIALAREAVESDLPFLGICRGMQVINVALGGSLYTDISAEVPGALKHNYYPDHPRSFIAHPVQLDEGSRLAKILGLPVASVNSLHHQAVRDLADGLLPTAYAPDGVLEAFELPEHPYGIAVQWHPEWLPDHAPMQALFRSFVEAAAERVAV